MSKILVTGGAGFLGSHLCETLLEKGHTVTAIDNLSTGRKENIDHLSENPNFSFLEFDVTNTLPDSFEADMVYHLASPASPNMHSKKSYHALAFETMQVNTIGTWKLAEFCLNKNAKLLYASTSETYGDPLEHPQKETYRGNVSTTGPRSVYDEAKRFGETIVAAFVREKDLDGRIIRIFNTYGPRMAEDDGRATIRFISQALANSPITIFGDGTQTRAFCYVDDLIAGIVLAMEKENTKGEVINLGNPSEFTIRDFAEKVKMLLNSSSEITNAEALPQDDPLRRCPDITKAKNLLGWEPKVSLEEGVQKMVEWMRNNA